MSNIVDVAAVLPLAQAAPAGPGGGDIMSMLPLFVIMLGIMYFLMVRPQQQKDKKKTEMLAQLAKGDSVVTAGGICGTVVGISESHVVVKVDDNTKIEFVKSSIAHRVTEEREAKK